jgi:uncharacterized protein
MSSDILQALMDWNPWLEQEFPKKLLGFERQYDMISCLELDEIKILIGARRVGKSTLLYQMIQHLLTVSHEILYINFQDETLHQYSLADVYYCYLQHRKVKYLFVDEIQYCSDWVHFIRKMYDRKELDQIWITGSNASIIKKEYAELFTGRHFSLMIHPLSFKEYLQFHQQVPQTTLLSREMQAKVMAYFMDYLKCGGFPAVVLKKVYRKELLQHYFDDFIYKDIASRYQVNVDKVKELGIYLASNTGKLLSYRRLANTLHLHPNTITDYISYFKQTFLFDELYKFDYSLKSQFSYDKKIYILDTGLAAAVSFKFSEDVGRMLETLVYHELKRRKQNIYFHRKKYECDFLIKKENRIVEAIQVCTSLKEPSTKDREHAGLLEAMQTYKLSEGLLLTLEEETQYTIENEGKIWDVIVKPIWKWLLECSTA